MKNNKEIKKLGKFRINDFKLLAQASESELIKKVEDLENKFRSERYDKEEYERKLKHINKELEIFAKGIMTILSNGDIQSIEKIKHLENIVHQMNQQKEWLDHFFECQEHYKKNRN